MKLNLLNLLKATVLKAGAIKTIAPTTESAKAAEFKNVLSDVQTSPPPGLIKTIPNVKPPVEKSAVLISKRYSESHAESQDNVKESVKSEKKVEQPLQTSISSSAAPAVVQATNTMVHQPKVAEAQRDMNQRPVENREIIEIEPVVSTSLESMVALTNSQKNVPVARGGGANVEKQTPTIRPVESPLSRLRMAAPDSQSTLRVALEAKGQDEPVSPVSKPPQKGAAPATRDASIVSSTMTAGVEALRESQPITAFALHPVADAVKQESVANQQEFSSVKVETESSVSREPDKLKSVPKYIGVGKSAEVTRPMTPRRVSLSQSDNKQGTISQPRGDASHAERVSPKLADAARKVESETLQYVNNRFAPAKEEVGAPIVTVSKPRLAASESVRAEIPQQVSNRLALAKGKVNIPMVRVTEPRVIVPEQVNHVVQHNERPRVVQQVWASNTAESEIKPMRAENAKRAQAQNASDKQKLRSERLTNVDNAFVRPTLEANAMKQPTLADTKLNAAVFPRANLRPEHVQDMQIEKQANAEPLHQAGPAMRDSIVQKQKSLKTAPHNTPKSENSEPQSAHKKAEVNAGTNLTAKMEQASVVTDRVWPMQPESVVVKPVVQRSFTPDTTLKDKTSIEVKSLEAKVQTATPQDARQNIRHAAPEIKREQSQARMPFAVIPEFELPKQPVLSASVNEPVRELLQTETTHVSVEQKLTPAMRIEPKLEARLNSLSDSVNGSEREGLNPKTPVNAKTDAPETLKDTAATTRLFKPLTNPEPQLQSMPQAMPVQPIHEFGTEAPRIGTMKAPEFMRNDRAFAEREEPASRSTQEKPQQVSEGKQSEQSNHNGQDAQSQSHERESGQPAVRQTIEQATQTSTHASISKSNHPSQSAANESLKFALQKALDQSRKRMIDPDELRMSIPFGELGTMDIDIVREAEKFSIRIGADPQAIAMMEDQRIQLTQWLRVQGYPVEQIDIAPRFGGEQKSDLAGSNQSTEERSSGEAGQFGHQRSGGSGAGEEHAEAAARPAFSGLRVWTA